MSSRNHRNAVLGAFAVLCISLLAIACGGAADDAPTGVTAAAASAERIDLGAWAASICAAGETLSATLNAINDGVVPSRLTFDQRKERALRLGPQQIDAALTFAEALDVESPGETAAYTSALIAQAALSAGALKAQLQEIQQATSNAEIEASNARRNVALVAADAGLQAAVDGLSLAARAAIGGVTRCGSIGG